MRNASGGGSLSNHQEVLLKRYHEIHFDYSTEFKNTSVWLILLFRKIISIRSRWSSPQYSGRERAWSSFSLRRTFTKMTRTRQWRSCCERETASQPPWRASTTLSGHLYEHQRLSSAYKAILIVKLLKRRMPYWVSAVRSPAPLADWTTCQVCSAHKDYFHLDFSRVYWAANVPGFGRLIDGIQRKKFRESLVIAVVVALLICIAIWCVPWNAI